MVDGALAGAVTGALIGTMVAPPPDDMDHADRDPRMGTGDAGAAMDDAADALKFERGLFTHVLGTPEGR